MLFIDNLSQLVLSYQFGCSNSRSVSILSHFILMESVMVMHEYRFNSFYQFHSAR